MIKHKDPFAFWVLSGIIGAYTRNAYNFFSKQIGFAKFYIWQVGASLFITQPQTKTFWGNVVGFLVDAVVGAFFGVLIGLLLEWRGQRNYIIKGWGVGLMAWMFFWGILYHNLPFTKANAPGEALSNISAFIGHSIFGIVAVVVYVKFFSKKFVESSDVKNSENTHGDKQKPMRFRLAPQPSRKIEEKHKTIWLKKPIKLR